MKNKRALSLIIAASMIIPQLAVMASAKNEYNYIKIEEEVIVENGNFDKEPVVKNDQSRAYHTQTPGTWSYQVNASGTADVTYVNDGGDGYLQVTAANVNPSVAYAFGTLSKGEYTLSLDITPESGSNIEGITVQVVWLDSGFNVGNAAYRLITENVTLTKGEEKNVSVPFSLTEDTKVAFRVYTNPDNPTNGNYRIDNLSLARPADVLIESADPKKVSSMVYTVDALDQLPAGTWVATDNTYLKLDNSTDGKIVAAKKDSGIPNISQVWYNFPEALKAGKYRLTFDVLTDETKAGNYGVADVTKKWEERYTLTETGAAQIIGGRHYTMTFEVPADNTFVGFRYFQTDDKTRPSAPFSIENVKLELYEEQAVVQSWEIVEENDFTKAPSDMRSFTNWTTGATSNIWALKTTSGAKPTHDAANGRLVFTNSSTGDGIIHKYYNGNTALTAGDYRFVFELDYDRKDGVTADYNISTPTNVYIAQGDTLWNNFKPGFTVNTATASTIEIPFTLTDATNAVYFRAYPNNAGNPPPKYYVDNYKLERANYYGWTEVYNSNAASAPTVKTDAGVSDNNRKNYKDAWLVRENNNAIAATNIVYSAGKLSVTANETAIFGKPTVMYRFNSTIAKGDYSVDTVIKNLANVGFGDTYTLSLHFSNGQEPVTLTKTVAKNTAVPVSLNFELSSDSNVVLCIQSTNASAAFTSAYELQEVTLSKLSNPLAQLTSNADLATFDSDDGVYYMTVNAQENTYVNYCDFRELLPGIYKLSGSFRTNAQGGTNVTASISNIDCGTSETTVTDEWTPIEYTVKIPNRVTLSLKRGIKLAFNTTEPVYFKDLSLVCVDRISDPQISLGIIMVLLKLREDASSPDEPSQEPSEEIVTPAVEYAINGGFDEEVSITHDQSRAYLKHEDGKWTYSKNSGEVKTSIYNDGSNSYAYFEVANANPSVGYKVGTLPAGKYTLSFDITPEYNIGNIRTRIFKLADGFAVGKAEYVLLDKTTSIQVSTSNTLTYEFVLTEETAVAFNFYATKENPCPENGSFRLDNVSVLKRP